MDRVSLRQFILLTFMLGLAMKMFNLPVLMLRLCGRDAFLTLIAELVIDLVLLALVIVIVACSGGRSFYGLICDAFGRVTARMAAAAGGLLALLKLYFMLVDVRLFFSNTVFPSSVGALHLVPLVVVLVYFATRPLSSAGRMSEVFAPFVVAGIVILGALTLPHVDFGGLRPFLADGPGVIGKGLVKLPMWFGDFVLLLAAAGKTDGGKKTALSLIAALAGFACLTVLAAVLFASYGDMPELLTYGHSISSIAQYAVGSFRFGRFDLVIFCLWLNAVFLSAGMMAAFFSRSMRYALGDKAGIAVTLVGSAALIVAMALTVNLNLAVEWAMEYFAPAAVAFCFGLPAAGLAALITVRIKEMRSREGKNEKNEPKNGK